MIQAEGQRAVAYTRVRYQSQVDGNSLDAQERHILDYCRERLWVPTRVYREEGRSARYEAIRKRPVFRDLLEDASNDIFDVVVVHTFDRWSRNMRATLESITTLSDHNVGLVSVTENLDWSTPEGRLVARSLGNFNEFFSDMLGVHTTKGIEERARQGKHLGSLPFGYGSCWTESEGERRRLCDPEHPGGVHIIPEEREAITRLFQECASGTTTLADLATWMNEKGYRTRSTRKLRDAYGNLVTGPRLFTTASIGGILHNPFYHGKVRHKNDLYQGLHEPIIERDLFEMVELTLRKNSGRSTTLTKTPEREYLLKGIIKCAHRLMPMWSQTYQSGRRYYREHRNSRSIADCPSSGGSILCEVPDTQTGSTTEPLELGPQWQEQVLTIIEMRDKAERVRTESESETVFSGWARPM